MVTIVPWLQGISLTLTTNLQKDEEKWLMPFTLEKQ